MNAIESALNQMSDHLRMLYDDSGEGVVIVDPRTERFVQANAALCQMLGYSEQELLSRGVRDVHPADKLSDVLQRFRTLSQTRLRSAEEVPFLRKDGGILYANVTTVAFTHEGQPLLLALVHDITAHKRAAEALHESEATLRGLLENLPDLVLLVDREGNTQFSNRDWSNADRDAMIGKFAFGSVMPDSQSECREALDRAIASGVPQNVAVQDLYGQWWSCRMVSLGDLKRAIVICKDVTPERSSAEAVKKEQRLLRQTLELQERERRLVACEIHDRFAQPITGALFRLQAFRETLARASARAWQDFDTANRMLATAIDETRRLISGLRPLILDELGIVEAIEYLVCERRLQEEGREIEFEHAMDCSPLPTPLQNAIFRIVQESLTNACRHSQSRRIHIEMHETDGRIQLNIRDWGVGFKPDDIPRDRFGLQTIRERVRLLDGRISIESSPDEGTHIAVELPLADGGGHASDLPPI